MLKMKIPGIMSKKGSDLSKKAGMAPGTIAYVGEARAFTPWIDVIEYGPETFTEAHKIEPDHCPEEDAGPSLIRWINVTGIHDIEVIKTIGNKFGLHALVLEDIVHSEQRAKLEDYQDYIYLVVKMIGIDPKNKEVTTEQLSIVIKNNTVLTFIEDEGDLFDTLRERIRKGNKKLLISGADYLLYSILDTIVDNYFIVLERIGDKLEGLEIRLLTHARAADVQELHGMKRELIYFRKFIWPMREVVSLLSKSETLQIKGNTSIYLRDVYDHCVQAIDTLETFRDLSSGLMDVYLSTLSNKMNMVMKTLTIISTIFIPLTFIVGVFGMNFNIPMFGDPNGYNKVWIFMIVLVATMLIWFKRRKWF